MTLAGAAQRVGKDVNFNRLLAAVGLTQRIQQATGIRITAHQFRHAAAAIYLKHRPGDYETVRRFLGHRSIQTTIRFYIGLQAIQATEEFGKVVRQQMNRPATNEVRTRRPRDQGLIVLTRHELLETARATIRSLPIENASAAVVPQSHDASRGARATRATAT
jgi:hypothetical protein